MILDLEALPPVLLAPPPEGSPTRRCGTIPESPISWLWNLRSGSGHVRPPEFLLASINDPSGPDLAFVAYSKQRPIGFGRVTTSLESPFAGLWGGSVLPDFRGAEFTERRATKRWFRLAPLEEQSCYCQVFCKILGNVETVSSLVLLFISISLDTLGRHFGEGSVHFTS